jgi:hypothetical protein
MQGAFDHGFELSNVAGPVVFLQHPGDDVVYSSYHPIEIGIEPLVDGGPAVECPGGDPAAAADSA